MVGSRNMQILQRTRMPVECRQHSLQKQKCKCSYEGTRKQTSFLKKEPECIFPNDNYWTQQTAEDSKTLSPNTSTTRTQTSEEQQNSKKFLLLSLLDIVKDVAVNLVQ
ncbi:hypothetical protein CEXT_160221 [Caerostris extrusa]|uniref:Uncharacterized protein n=1 Tax=Caerostris extrusa TaxID=172846 RepID=A0AAV4PHC2_CAEEX|nr:hypothetical protein CEXT_160221 [Caerostris extrusa]